MLKRFVNYCKLSYNELVHKTTWPTRKQLTSQAILVLEASLLIALVVFVMDQAFQFVMEFVYPN
ncbi:MAG: preprotein translocase subunit SecE [Alistipes sp.]|nr:preprotein translocase subunit SecE [Bacteroidaceae bacterium]MBR6662881.1 preprotein translocase subunit SecE [Alistipes sp.]